MTAIVTQINPDKVAALAQSGALLLDVRSAAEFRGGHVSGAVNLPLEEVHPAALQKHLGINLSRPVVLLCTAGTRAHRAASQLNEGGFDLRVVQGGTQACQQAGLPMSKDAGGSISIERQVRIAAGTLVFTGVLLGATVHPGFYGLSAFLGAGLVFAGVTDWCGMGLLIAKAPWNK